MENVEEVKQQRPRKKLNLPPEFHNFIKQAFDMFDKDKSGSIDARELQIAMLALGVEVTIDEAQIIIQQFDEDHNQKIDYGEFENMIIEKIVYLIKAEKDPLQELRKAFRWYDSDEDGYISLEDLKVTCKMLNVDWDEEKLIELIECADKDHDKKISEDEFLRVMKKMKLM